MKKYGMIFASVIFTLLIMLIPGPKVNADEYDVKTLNYTKFTETYETIKDNLEEARLFLEDYKDEYYYIISFNKNNEIDLYIVKKFSTNLFIYYKDNGSLSSYTIQNNSDGKSHSNYKIEGISIDEWETDFLNFKNKVLNGSLNNNSTSYIKSGLHTGVYVYYTNMDFVVNNDTKYNSSLYSFDLNGNIYNPGEKISTYYETLNSNEIKISSSFICDSNGKDAEYVTINFSNYTSSEYSYQYGIQRKKGSSIIWYDIEELNNYMYSFNEYYNNTIIYARVLDSYGNEVVINECVINNEELPIFELIISSSLACPIPNYEGDPQAEIIIIDFTNAYSENYKYYYSYTGQTKYEINVSSDNLLQQITEYLYQFMYFYVYDENNKLIYYTYGDVSSSDRLGYIPYDYELRHKIIFNLNPGCDRQGNEILNLQFDFSNITKYINHYNFDVVINGNHLGAIQYYNLILDGSNYLDNLNYEVKIYIDDYIYASGNYSVGSNSSSFDDIYNDTLNDISSESINNHESLFNLFINALNHFRDVIVDIFNTCTYLFENLSPVLKYFYISVFILILFGFLIKFIL